MHREDTEMMHKVMHREDMEMMHKVMHRDSSPPIQKNFSSGQQRRVNYFNNKPNAAKHYYYNSLSSSAANRYFATFTLSPDELDSFRAFLPVIDNFYHFKLYVKNKQRAREHRNHINYGYEQIKPEVYAVPQRAANPTLEAMGGQFGTLITKKTQVQGFFRPSKLSVVF